jgi:pentatricopeptide repeat protein
MTDLEKGTGFKSTSNLNVACRRGPKVEKGRKYTAAYQTDPARAEALLDRMSRLYVEPDVVSYNTVILAWSNAGEPKRAEALLEEMFHAWVQDTKEGHADSIRPDRVTFNTVISAWARSNDPDAAERAQSILRRMYDAQDMGALKVTPNIVTYNTMLDC